MRVGLSGSWNYKEAKKLVQASGYKRSWIADQVGISTVTLTAILNGRPTSPQTVKLLAQVLGCTEDDLLLEKKAS